MVCMVWSDASLGVYHLSSVWYGLMLAWECLTYGVYGMV